MIIKEEKKVDYCSQCPFNKDTTDLHEMIERFKVEFAKLSMDEQLQFVRDNAFLNSIWQCGRAEAIKRYEGEKGNPTEFESLGNHLRNLLSPYQFLVDAVSAYNDDEFDESEFKRIIGNAQIQKGLDKVIESTRRWSKSIGDDVKDADILLHYV